MARTNQGGSVLGFAVIGGVMALLLIGGALVVRHALTPAAAEEIVAVEEDDTDTESEGEWKPLEDEEQADETPEVSGESNNQSQTERPSPEALPETGPADVFFSGVLLSVLIAAAVAYKRSASL